jgi:hypothetical protein
MNISTLARLLAACAIFLFTSSAWADGPPKPADRKTVLAKLKANKVGLQNLTTDAQGGGPGVFLGTGEFGGEENNATDENLRLVARLPELERVSIFKGKVSANGLAALAALPKLRYLQIYATDVPAAAFAFLAKLTQLKTLSLGEYPVSDEVMGYAGQINGLKGFDHTKSAITPAGFLKFLNGVESLEQLTLFGISSRHFQQRSRGRTLVSLGSPMVPPTNAIRCNGRARRSLER